MGQRLSKCLNLLLLDSASPARPTDQAHPCCTEGETEAGQAMGASGRRQGQPAQPRPCRDPLALQKDDPSASTLLCPTVGRQPSTEHHAHPVLPSPAQPPSTGSTSVSTCPTSARASSYH